MIGPQSALHQCKVYMCMPCVEHSPVAAAGQPPPLCHKRYETTLKGTSLLLLQPAAARCMQTLCHATAAAPPPSATCDPMQNSLHSPRPSPQPDTPSATPSPTFQLESAFPIAFPTTCQVSDTPSATPSPTFQLDGIKLSCTITAYKHHALGYSSSTSTISHL